MLWIWVEAGSVPARLVTADTGSLDGLRFVACPRQAPGAGEVEVAIEAAALNFKDVMKALGLLDAAALERSYLGHDLGMEAVGTVVRSGDDGVPVGSRVLVYSGGVLRTHAVVDARFVVPCPEGWTAEQAASFFVTATAWHALVDVGRVRAGETVLVHSAAGGVGLAAVGICRALGARVIATAGTERKRAWLREQGLDVVLDSRTLDFGDAVRRATGGRGVDVVLNALAGPAIEQGLRCLAPGGRFLELGKKDLADGRALALGAFNRRLTFSAIDLDRAATEDPGYFGPLARAVLQAFAAGRISHLPAQVFGADAVVDAFRALSGGDCIGKVVVGLRGGAMGVYAAADGRLRPRPGRSWLVTGGTSGFGLELARSLVEAGVTHLVLASRSGRLDAEARRELGARASVEVVALDVADADAVAALVARIGAGPAPLGGVVHAATVYADAPLGTLTGAGLDAALGAKARGAWNLHLATRGVDLDAFLLCSSVSAQVGNPGQGAYAAANTFLEGLAELRRAEGLPATAVVLGALDAGLVARDPATAAHLRGLGLSPMPAALAAEAMLRAAAEGHARIGAIDIDWDTWMGAHPDTAWTRLAELRRGTAAVPTGLAERLAALPESERHPAAVAALVTAAAPVFRTDPSSLDPRRPLRDQGLDSLMAVELAAALRRGVGVEVSAMDLLGGRGLAALAERLVAPPVVVATAPVVTRPSLDPVALRAAICVEAPYEALEDLRVEGDAVVAEVRPVALGGDGPVSAAELGRHLAILGSMAVAALHPEGGRHAYPVHTAEIELDDREGPPVARARARARALACDPGAGHGEAETTLHDLDGRRLGRMRVRYHVLPMDTFRALFADRAVPTPAGADPYGRFTPPTRVSADADRLVFELPPVAAADCVGHFAGLPAMPVSILGRHVFAVVSEAAAWFGDGSRPRLARARLETHRFVWAGERARLEVTRGEEGWSCVIRVGDEVAARFVLELAEELLVATGK